MSTVERLHFYSFLSISRLHRFSSHHKASRLFCASIPNQEVMHATAFFSIGLPRQNTANDLARVRTRQPRRDVHAARSLPASCIRAYTRTHARTHAPVTSRRRHTDMLSPPLLALEGEDDDEAADPPSAAAAAAALRPPAAPLAPPAALVFAVCAAAAAEAAAMAVA